MQLKDSISRLSLSSRISYLVIDTNEIDQPYARIAQYNGKLRDCYLTDSGIVFNDPEANKTLWTK